MKDPAIRQYFPIRRSIDHLLFGLIVVTTKGTISVRRHSIGEIECIEVTPDELDRIEMSGSDVGFEFQVALFCLTEALSITAAMATMTPGSERVFTVFTILMVFGYFFAAIYGIKWLRSKKAFSTVIQKVRERQIGTLGSEENQVKPSELADLPASQPSGDAQ